MTCPALPSLNFFRYLCLKKEISEAKEVYYFGRYAINEIPQTGWLREKCIFSQFWRLKVLQGVGRAGLS